MKFVHGYHGAVLFYHNQKQEENYYLFKDTYLPFQSHEVRRIHSQTSWDLLVPESAPRYHGDCRIHSCTLTIQLQVEENLKYTIVHTFQNCEIFILD